MKSFLKHYNAIFLDIMYGIRESNDITNQTARFLIAS